MTWWRWLFDTGGFRTPQHGLGLSPALVWVTIAAGILQALVYGTMAGVLAWFRVQRSEPRYFRQPLTALAFAGLLATATLNAAVRSLLFLWPCYRLQAATAALQALTAFAVLVLMIPVAAERDLLRVRRERHAFADKVHTDQLKITTNLLRIERLEAQQQAALSELLAVIQREKQRAGPAEARE